MKQLMVLFFACITLTFLTCSQQSTSPVSTDTSQPVAQEVPEDVEKLLDENDYKEEAFTKQMAYGVRLDESPYDAAGYYDIYTITFLWGHLHNAVTSDISLTDWTGSLSVNGEADVKVVNTIGFEEGQDYLVPVTTPSQVAWVSFTAGDFDGINFLIYVRNDVEYFAPLTLSFATEPFAVTYEFSNLHYFKAYYQIDNINAVAVYARKLYPHHCPRGYMKGKWIRDDNTGAGGRFEGIWYDDRKNEPTGYYVGQFWTTEDGRRLFQGSVSGYITDQIIAYFKGYWFYDDMRLCPQVECGISHGWYYGRFDYPHVNGGGYMRGEIGWPDPTSVDAASIPMRGIWREYCPGVSSAQGSN